MRPKKKSEHLTRLEMEIMNVLWETGPASVQTVQQLLGRNLAYTTVQTMLNVLVRKKKVARTLKDRAYYYRHVVSREKVAGHAIKDLIDRLFCGSAESLVMSLVESRHITPEKLTTRSTPSSFRNTRVFLRRQPSRSLNPFTTPPSPSSTVSGNIELMRRIRLMLTSRTMRPIQP
jgi:BlaI family penicillinase repressor